MGSGDSFISKKPRPVTVPEIHYNPRTMNPVLTEKVIYEWEEKEPGDGLRDERRLVEKRSVAWLQDMVKIGGAEISCMEVVRIGKDCGFEINVLDQRSPASAIEKTLMKSDIAVLNNVWSFGHGQMKVILGMIYEKGLPYVKYEHDNREIGRPEFSRPLFARSKLNVFISPMHLKNHLNNLGCNGICLPLAIDTGFFKPDPLIQRRPNTGVVPGVRKSKSYVELQKYIDGRRDILFTVIGSHHGIHGKNVKAIPVVPYKQMPALYSGFEYLVHLPSGLGAGERVIFEAALCGCKVVANEKTGHMSWKRNLSDTEGLKKWLKQAPSDFWKEIDKVM